MLSEMKNPPQFTPTSFSTPHSNSTKRTDLMKFSRASIRAARLLELQKEQQREDDEALKMTEDQRQTLFSSFSSVKLEFFDLDGLSWSQSTLKRRMQHLTGTGRRHRYTVSESDINPNLDNLDLPSVVAEMETKSAIAALGTTSTPRTKHDDDEDDEDKNQTIRAVVSPVKNSFDIDSTPKQEVKDDQNSFVTQDTFASTYTAGVALERSRSKSFSENPIQVKVVKEVEISNVNADAGKLDLFLQQTSSQVLMLPPPSISTNLVSHRDAPPPPTTSPTPTHPTRPPCSLERLRIKRKLSSSTSSTSTSPRTLGRRGSYSSFRIAKSRSSPSSRSRLGAKALARKRKDTPIPCTFAMFETQIKHEDDPAAADVLPGRTRSLPEGAEGSKKRKDTPMPGTLAALAYISSSSPKANFKSPRLDTSLVWEEVGDHVSWDTDNDPFAMRLPHDIAVAPKSGFKEDVEEEEEVETDLEGGAVMRRAPMSPRTRPGPRRLPQVVYPEFELYLPSLPDLGREEEVKNEEEDNEVTIKAPKFQISLPQNDVAQSVSQQMVTAPVTVVGPTPTIAMELDSSSVGLSFQLSTSSLAPAHARIPSLDVKSKQDLMLATSACGLASPSVLTPTPSLIRAPPSTKPIGDGNGDDTTTKSSYPPVPCVPKEVEDTTTTDGTKVDLNTDMDSDILPASNDASFGIGLGFPSSHPSTESSQANKRKRGHTSGRSISSSGSLLGITNISILPTSDGVGLKAEKINNTVAVTPSRFLPRPMSPPSPPTVAFVTASRSNGGRSGAVEGLKAVSSSGFAGTSGTTSSSWSRISGKRLSGMGKGRPRAGTIASACITSPSISSVHTATHAHGPNANSVRRKDWMGDVHACADAE